MAASPLPITEDIIEKIKHTNRRPSSLRISYLIEELKENTPTWEPYMRLSLLMDNLNKNTVSHAVYFPDENKGKQFEKTIYEIEERLVTINRLSRRESLLTPQNEFIGTGEVFIKKRIPVEFAMFDFWNNPLFTKEGYHSFSEIFPLKTAKFTRETLDSSECVKIELKKTDLFFQIKTGRLLKKVFRNKRDIQEFVYDDYINVQEHEIPTQVKLRCYSNGKLNYSQRWKVKREDVEIGKTYPSFLFIPSIPAGALVSDEIEKKKYQAQGLSEAEKNALRFKHLDEIFRKSEK
jgi:hypothetical protein